MKTENTNKNRRLTDNLCLIHFAEHMNGSTSSGNPSVCIELSKEVKDFEGFDVTPLQVEARLDSLVYKGYLTRHGGNYETTKLGREKRDKLCK